MSLFILDSHRSEISHTVFVYLWLTSLRILPLKESFLRSKFNPVIFWLKNPSMSHHCGWGEPRLPVSLVPATPPTAPYSCLQNVFPTLLALLPLHRLLRLRILSFRPPASSPPLLAICSPLLGHLKCPCLLSLMQSHRPGLGKSLALGPCGGLQAQPSEPDCLDSNQILALDTV